MNSAALLLLLAAAGCLCGFAAAATAAADDDVAIGTHTVALTDATFANAVATKNVIVFFHSER